MKCSNCNAKIQKGKLFCTNCGVPVNDNGNAGYSINTKQTNNKVKKERVKWSWEENRFSGLSHFESVIICMLMIVVAIAGALCYTVSSAFSKQVIKKTISEINISELEVGALMGSSKSDAKLADVIYDDLIGPTTAKKFNIKKRDVKNFIDSKEVQNFVSEELNAYYEYVVEDEGKGIKSSDIVTFARNNSELFEEELNFKPTNNDYIGMEIWLDNELGKGGRFEALGKEAKNYYEEADLNKYVDAIGLIGQDNVKILIALLGIALMLTMILIDKNRVYIAFNYLWVVNIINTIICAVLYWGRGIIGTLLEKYANVNKELFNNLSGGLLSGMMFSMKVFLMLAAAFFLVGIIIKYTVPLFKRKVA